MGNPTQEQQNSLIIKNFFNQVDGSAQHLLELSRLQPLPSVTSTSSSSSSRPQSTSTRGLILTQTQSTIKNILEGTFVREKNHYSVYHVWLDCLYSREVNYDDILSELSQVLDTRSKRKSLKISNIFIIGGKYRDGSIRPAGSCYILLPESLSQCPNCTFESDLIEKRIHMIEVSFPALRHQLKENHVFTLAEVPSTAKSPGPTAVNNNETKTNNNNNTKATGKSDKTMLPELYHITKENMPKLRKIESKGRASTILSNFNADTHVYVRFRSFGIRKIHPSIFKAMIPDCTFQWENAFITGMTDKSISGVIALDKSQDALLIKVVSMRGVNFAFDQKVSYDIFKISENDFRSSILNIRQASEFIIKSTPTNKTMTFENEQQPTTTGGGFNLQPATKQSTKTNNQEKVKQQAKISPPPGITNSNQSAAKKMASVSNDTIEKLLENEIRRIDFVTKTLPQLLNHGTVVLRVDNFPAKSFQSFNLMMGTYTLINDQIVAAREPRKGGDDLMNVRIVLPAGNVDIKSILSKHNCTLTAHNTKLVCKQTDLKELETFLTKSFDKIQKLDKDDKLQLQANGIAYGKCNANNATDNVHNNLMYNVFLEN